ncbi:hypothetical protein FPV67DRAFT_1779552 [Lyophyllum atratum]|nr:hypothetical protein FPV67DRAFT_1779552 [Lyophyllum atratum]
MSGLHDILRAEQEAAEGRRNAIPIAELAPGAPVAIETIVDKDAGAEPGEKTTATVDETLGRTTSKDVDRGMGKPASGMTSKELHHNGHPKREKSPQIHYAGKKPPEVQV